MEHRWLAVVATVGPFRLLRDASTRRWFWKVRGRAAVHRFVPWGR